MSVLLFIIFFNRRVRIASLKIQIKYLVQLHTSATLKPRANRKKIVCVFLYNRNLNKGFDFKKIIMLQAKIYLQLERLREKLPQLVGYTCLF